MARDIKQMEIDSLQRTFGGVRDVILLSVSGVDAQFENQTRIALAKKNIRLKHVKNSLARLVFEQAGLKTAAPWQGPTTVAWGADSIKDLSKALEDIIKKNEKFKVKTAIADGQEVTFDQALKMPTRLEAIGSIIGSILGPGSAIAGCLTGPASLVASQIQTISEKKAEEEAAPAATAG